MSCRNPPYFGPTAPFTIRGTMRTRTSGGRERRGIRTETVGPSRSGIRAGFPRSSRATAGRHPGAQMEIGGKESATTTRGRRPLGEPGIIVGSPATPSIIWNAAGTGGADPRLYPVMSSARSRRRPCLHSSNIPGEVPSSLRTSRVCVSTAGSSRIVPTSNCAPASTSMRAGSRPSETRGLERLLTSNR